MNAVYALGFNAIVATLFASAFLAIGALYPAFRRVWWFSLSYAIGALTPVSTSICAASLAPKLARIAPVPRNPLSASST